MRTVIALILLLPLTLFAQVEVRRYGTMTELLAANPTAFSVAGKATVIVSGRTNSQDGWSRVLAYSSSDTNAADNLTIFAPNSPSIPGRYRLLYLENPTNSSVRAGILPPYQSGSIWLNGAWVPLSSVFSAGTNMQVTVTSNSVSYGMTNATGASSIKWEGITVSNPNLRDTAYVYWTPSGSDLRANIVANSIDNSRLEEMQTGYVIGRYSGTFGTPEYISIGANLSLSGDGVLSAVVASGATNGTPVSVDGGSYLLGANFTDSSEIDHSVSGTNVTALIVSNSVATNKLDSNVLGLILNQHFVNGGIVLPLVLTNNVLSVPSRVVFGTNAAGHVVAYATNIVSVNGTVVAPINILNSAEVSASVSGGTNVYFSLNSGSVALSKLVDVPTSSLLGRGTLGTGAVERVTIGTGLALTTNGVLSATGTNATVIRVGGTQVTSPNIIDTSEIDVSISLSTNVLFDLFPSSVVFSKLQSIQTARLLGRSTAGSGSIEQISLGSGLSLAAGVLSASGGSGSVDVSTNYTWTGNHSFLGTTVIDSLTVTNLLADSLQLPFASALLLANSSSNIAAVTIGSGLSLVGSTLSATGSGGGTVVTVDGGADQTRVNLSDSSDIGVAQTTTNATFSINSDAVTFAKIQNISTSRLIGRSTASSGDPEEIQVGSGLSLSSGILSATGSSGATNVGSLIQVKGLASFTMSSGSSLQSLSVSGYVTNVVHDDGTYSGSPERGLFTVQMSPSMPNTNYVVLIQVEGEDPTGLGSPNAAVVQSTKTTSQFKFVSRFDGSEAMPAAKYIVWVMDSDGAAVSTTATTVSLPYGGYYWSPEIGGTSTDGSPIVDWVRTTTPVAGAATALRQSYGGTTWSYEITGLSGDGSPILDLIPQ